MDTQRDHQKAAGLGGVMEYPFDFQSYIQERLRDIRDLDERHFAKEVLLNGMGKAIQAMERKYEDLQERVYQEIEPEHNRYEISMTVIDRRHFDPTNHTLFPVREEGLAKDGGGGLGVEGRAGELYVGTVFSQWDGPVEGEFGGAVSVGAGEEPRKAVFLARPSRKYRKHIEALYDIFRANFIPWTTVNTAYLDRFYDIFLKLPQGEEKEMREPLSWKDCEIEFGGLGGGIRYDMIPVWNIERIVFKSTDFVIPCIDGIYYEHEFLTESMGGTDGYLIEPNEEILEIRHEKGRIIIKSLRETFESWQALRLAQSPTEYSLDYRFPCLTNRKKDSFFRRYSGRHGGNLMTKHDLFRRIMELDIEDYMEVTGYQILEDAQAFPIEEGMNWFIRDELFPMDQRKLLVLEFKEKRPGHFLNKGIIRFVISQMQLEISEYRCVGVTV